MTTSYTKVCAINIISACDDYLDAKDKRIEKKREEMISKVMKKKHFWYPCANYTREEAIDSLQEPDSLGISPWFECTITGSDWSDEIEQLKKLASVAQTLESMVYLSDKHASLIYRYMV